MSNNRKNRGGSAKPQVQVKSVDVDADGAVIADVTEIPSEPEPPVQAMETATPVDTVSVEPPTPPRGMQPSMLMADEGAYQPEPVAAPATEQNQLANWPDTQSGRRLKEASDMFFLELAPKRPVTASRISELHLALYSAINYALTTRNEDEGVAAYRRFVQACRTQLNGAMHPTRRNLCIGRVTHLTKAQITAQEYLLDVTYELAVTGAKTTTVAWDALLQQLIGGNTENMVTRIKMSSGINA